MSPGDVALLMVGVVAALLTVLLAALLALARQRRWRAKVVPTALPASPPSSTAPLADDAQAARRSGSRVLMAVLGAVSGVLFGAIAWSGTDQLPATATGEEIVGLVVRAALVAACPGLLAGWLAVGRYGDPSESPLAVAVSSAGSVALGAGFGTFVVVSLFAEFEDPGGEIAPYLFFGQLVLVVPVASVATLVGFMLRRALTRRSAVLSGPRAPASPIPRSHLTDGAAGVDRRLSIASGVLLLAGALVLAVLGQEVFAATRAAFPEAPVILAMAAAGLLAVLGYNVLSKPRQ